MKIILIDNFDSFSYNLVDLLLAQGHEVTVLRNNVTISNLKGIIGKDFSKFLFVLSPGPGTPHDAGNLMDIIHTFQGQIPILGICLGHQAIVECHGGKVVRATEVVHGKSSKLSLSKHRVFSGLGASMTIARYHSLRVDELPLEISVLAKFEDMPMVILHRDLKLMGIQFHPESILTPNGAQLLSNAISFLGETL